MGRAARTGERRPRPSSAPSPAVDAAHPAHGEGTPEAASQGSLRAVLGHIWGPLLIVYVVWGSTYLAIRVAVETIPPFLMASARFLVGGAVLYLVTARRGDREHDPIGWSQWFAALVVGGLLLFVGNGGVSWAEQRVPIGVTALMIATIPGWMVLAAWVLDRERVRLGTVAGLGLGFLGTVLLIRTGGRGGGSIDPAGAIVLLVAAVSWATGSVLSRRLRQPRRPLVATAMQMLCGGVLLLMVGTLSGEWSRVHVHEISLASVLGVLYLIVFGSWIAFTAYVWLLRHAPTSVVSTYPFVNPVIAIVLGWWILGEALAPLTAVAAALILGGVVLVLSTEARTRRRAIAAAECEPPA
jgi:drug/metabolite transporter (DMT)-like permease